MPLEEKVHTVPHLKAIISGEDCSSWQEHIRTFKYHYTLSGTLLKSTQFGLYRVKKGFCESIAVLAKIVFL